MPRGREYTITLKADAAPFVCPMARRTCITACGTRNRGAAGLRRNGAEPLRGDAPRPDRQGTVSRLLRRGLPASRSRPAIEKDQGTGARPSAACRSGRLVIPHPCSEAARHGARAARHAGPASTPGRRIGRFKERHVQPAATGSGTMTGFVAKANMIIRDSRALPVKGATMWVLIVISTQFSPVGFQFAPTIAMQEFSSRQHCDDAKRVVDQEMEPNVARINQLLEALKQTGKMKRSIPLSFKSACEPK